MKCNKCKFQNIKIQACTYPFNSIADGDYKSNNNGIIISYSHKIKK